MRKEDFKALIAFCVGKLGRNSLTVSDVLDCLEEYNNTVKEDATLYPEEVFITFFSIR